MNDVVAPYDLLVRFHWILLTGPQTTDGFARLEDKTSSRLNGEKHSASCSFSEVSVMELKLCAVY